MRNFLYKISSALARCMYGRNGSDALNAALLVLYLAMYLLSVVFSGSAAAERALWTLSLLLAAALLFRLLSRNLARRRAENAWFLSWWLPVKNRVSGAWRRLRDRDHRYFTCKRCKAVCRVPAGKGKIEITCPKCGEKIIGKS